MSERSLPLDLGLFRPGLRVMIAVSGGADSVALLRALQNCAGELGIILSVAHVHHGIRGASADADADFVAALAGRFRLDFLLHRADVPARAAQQQETLEEAARNTRYAFFRECIASGKADAVTTAHTLDDQAETVLLKLIRGAWTEGLSGIHPEVEVSGGRILRPVLAARRAEIEEYLRGLGQDWREDESNREPTFTRNRVRHQLLPILAEYNPQIASHLSALAAIARDEEQYWQHQLASLLPQVLLPGKPVRGGGRAAQGSSGIALEVERVRRLDPAVQRRVLRAAVAQAGGGLDYAHTESLLAITIHGGAGQRLSLQGDLIAERTPRELRISPVDAGNLALPEYRLPVPGEVAATAFGLRFRAEAESAGADAVIRAWKPGDRVTLRYSRGPKKVKEVLERMRIPAPERSSWPVVIREGRIVWIRGAEVEPEPGLKVLTEVLGQ
jgi:tRNA(Ile)-lysidine synthase